MARGRGSTLMMALAAVLLILTALAGCGSGSSATDVSTSAGPHAEKAAGGAKGRYATEEPAQSRGIKGESPTTEAASALRIGVGDCNQLTTAVEHGLGRELSHDSKPTPPLSKCDISGPGVSVNVFLDSGFAAHQRYRNRMEETVQFGTSDPSKVPHPVPNVGEKGAYDENASWVPALGSLFAVRGNRWITVAYSVAGQGNRQSREEAADLARLAFKLTAD